MHDLLHRSERVASAAGDERWALVQRIASSRQLGKASQLREILLYICRRTLDENVSSISEQEIGCKVLGRRDGFNPNEDNIVRAQVRHLRQKLQDYFNSEGAGERLVLSIPKGGYLPHFETRAAEFPPPVPAESRLRRQLPWITSGVIAVLAIVAAVLWKQRPVAAHAPAAPEAIILRADPLLSKIFTAGRDTNIVMADTCLVMLQDILDVDVPLGEYLKGGYPEKLAATAADPKLSTALRLIATRQYTSLGDAAVAARLLEVSRRYTAHTNVRYARHIGIREFKTGNFILIGSRRGMPWVQLFEPRLNFYMEEDKQTHKYRLHNLVPARGEKEFYEASKEGASSPETYADIALLPNLDATGYVMVLNGIDMAATEAAGEMVAGPDFGLTVTRLLGSRPGQSLPPVIEVLLEAKTVGGTSGYSKIVAYRPLR